MEIVSFNGSLTYKIENNNSTSVLQFVYEKNIDQVAYDEGYRQEVVLRFLIIVPIKIIPMRYYKIPKCFLEGIVTAEVKMDYSKLIKANYI